MSGNSPPAPARASLALALFALAACSTQVDHPLLGDELEREVRHIDLDLPPAARGPAATDDAEPAPETVHEDLAPAAGAAEPAATAPRADSGGDAPGAAVVPAAEGAPEAGQRETLAALDDLAPAAGAPPDDRAAAAQDAGDGLPAAVAAGETAAAAKAAAGAADTEPGAQRLDLGIADVRRDALTNNLEIKTEIVRPAIAGEQRREAAARFLPTAFARYAASKFDQPGIALARAPNESDVREGEIGVSVPLQTGGTARISMPVTRTDPNVVGFGNLYDTGAALSISQPLLRDAGRGVNIAPITIARLSERQQDAGTKLAILNVLAGADRLYWQLYAATASVQVRLQQYERAREQERQALRLSAEGVAPAIEVVRARAGVARRIADVILAENSRRQAERNLKRAMNRADAPVTGRTTLVTTTQPEPVAITIDRNAALEVAYDKRMELVNLELQLAIDALGVRIAQNQKLPALALEYSFRYLGASTLFRDALDQIANEDFYDQRIGLSLEVPLGNVARDARYRQAVLQRALTAANQAQQRQLVERQVLDAIDSLEEAWQRILSAREETLLAARNYEAEKRQFLLGVRTGTDVLISADFLADAQIREVNALATYEVAKIDIAFSTGTLLGNGQIAVEDYDDDGAVERYGQADQQPDVEPPVTETPQESIARKLDRLGVKPPPSTPPPGMPGGPEEGDAAGATDAPAAPAGGGPAGDSTAPPAAAGEAPAAVPENPDEATSAPTPDAAVTPGVTGPANDARTVGPVTAQDTLWALARDNRPDAGVSIEDMVARLVAANPEVFPDGDASRLPVGAVLRLP